LYYNDSGTEKHLLSQYHHGKNCLICDIRFCVLWNWEKNGCHFTMWTSGT